MKEQSGADQLRRDAMRDASAGAFPAPITQAGVERLRRVLRPEETLLGVLQAEAD